MMPPRSPKPGTVERIIAGRCSTEGSIVTGAHGSVHSEDASRQSAEIRQAQGIGPSARPARAAVDLLGGDLDVRAVVGLAAECPRVRPLCVSHELSKVICITAPRPGGQTRGGEDGKAPGAQHTVTMRLQSGHQRVILSGGAGGEPPDAQIRIRPHPEVGPMHVRVKT